MRWRSRVPAPWPLRVGQRHPRDRLQGATTFLVAHRLSTVRHADQILVVEHGRITERGTHASLMDADGWHARMYRAQQGFVARREAAPSLLALSGPPIGL